jgi:tetratricopeptide (TPR) repeat protein
LEISPHAAEIWNTKGIALGALGRYKKAIVGFDKALEIDPRLISAWHNKGRTLYERCCYEEAIECYNNVLKIDTRCSSAWESKGNALSALGRRKEAIACYDKALEIDPRIARAWYNKALMEDATSEFANARDSYTRFVECASPHDTLLLPLAKQRLSELGKQSRPPVRFSGGPGDRAETAIVIDAANTEIGILATALQSRAVRWAASENGSEQARPTPKGIWSGPGKGRRQLQHDVLVIAAGVRRAACRQTPLSKIDSFAGHGVAGRV